MSVGNPGPIPDVPEQDLSQGSNPIRDPYVLPPIVNPYLSVWWSTQTVSQVPENVMGWLVAQGYEITGITQDETTTPPTNYFALTKQGMQPELVLLNLCNSYTVAANEARESNQVRYNQVVYNWAKMIDGSHDQFNAQVAEQNAQAGMYLADLDEYMDAIEGLITDNQTQLALDADEAKDALKAMDSRLSELETNASDNATIIGTLLDEQDTNLTTYISDYDAKLAEMDANVAAHIATVLAEVTALETVLDTHVADYLQQFDALAANYNAHVADIDALLTAITNNVNTYVTDVDAILTLLDTDYQAVDTDLSAIRVSAGTLVDNYATDYQAILDLLASDYTTHAPLVRSIVAFLGTDYDSHETSATGFLTGLGTTELARINEEFAARLATQLQMLTTRGLYTSALVTDITERNQRDRDEQIQLLNDRLNREKFDNQHRLYEQQRVMRTQTIDNEHRLYEQQLGMRGRTLDGTSQLHSVRQEVLRYQASLISGVYALLQETRNRTLSGKQAIFAARDANGRLGIEVQSRLYSQLQDVRQRTIEASDRIYQLRDAFAKWENGETHRLYEQLQQVEQLFVECIQRQLAAKQEVTRTEISERDTLLQQLQTALTGLLGGKERFSTLLLANANTLAEHKHRAIVERMNTATKRLEGWKSIADENRQLMAYQLDQRNQLLIGLYSFVERREDIGPVWSDQADIIARLGDTGGWITP
jgi:hypothetical protein